MEKKHSPLDWRFIERSNPEKSTIPFGIEKAYNSAVEPIADICAFPPNDAIQLERMKANAELICTAVNSYYPMLEALKAVQDSKRNWVEINSMVKAAIAKAENKQ